MEKTINLLYELLYKKSKKELLSYINNCIDPLMLHYIAANYNWDNGYDIPSNIIGNKCCDIGTALMIFESADGYMLFLEESPVEHFGKRIGFIKTLKTRLEAKDFASKTIMYIPELSRVDIYKLKKRHSTLDPIFIKGTDGMEVKIPIV